jgi:2-C-methyl-D-erythritol 4-phosphate cytidylyltransferase
MNDKVKAIVPAAGLGRRFGPGTNKPFEILDGKPLIVWSLETLGSVETIEEIIPVLKEADREKAFEVFKQYKLSKIKKIAPGGKERQDSVYNGLKLIEGQDCIVLIHDGARPFIQKNLIEKAIRELLIPHSPPVTSGDEGGVRVYDGIILGVPVRDTIKEAKGEIIKKTLKRDSLWAIQTPQVFHYRTIFSAYEKAVKERFYSTDDAALVEKYGGKIRVIMGSYRNMKITTPEDLSIAEYLLDSKNADIVQKFI